jgi:predicted permease
MDAPVAYFSRVTPGYFPAMNTRILRGRDFSDFDNKSTAPVAMVNEKFAQRFWPGEDPIGRRFRLGNAESQLLQVIGVVQNGKYGGLTEDPKTFVALPMWQSYAGSTYVVARTQADPQRLLALIRSEVLQLDPHIPIANAGMLAEQLNLPLLPARVAAGVLGGFGVLGLALAAIGIYGVISHSAAKRMREMGIRIALGAQRSDVLKLVIGQGMALALVGVALGLLVAFSLTRLMKAVLFGVSATDPIVFSGIAALLAVVAFLACYLPARRASKVDPMVALRYE